METAPVTTLLIVLLSTPRWSDRRKQAASDDPSSVSESASPTASKQPIPLQQSMYFSLLPGRVTSGSRRAGADYNWRRMFLAKIVGQWVIWGLTPMAVTTHRQTHPVDGRAWRGLAEGQTKRDMEAPNRGKVHSLNDHRPVLKVGEGAGWRQVRDHRMRTRVLTFTM